MNTPFALDPDDFFTIPCRGKETVVLTEKGLRRYAKFNGVAEKVMTLQRLHELQLEKRSVYSSGPMLQKPKPAAVVINMSGQIILQLIQSGLYVYEPKSKQENK